MTGFIVPVSLCSVDGFDKLRSLLAKTTGDGWYSSFAERPAKLFDGVEKRLSIWIGRQDEGGCNFRSARYHRWLSQERSVLFSLGHFESIPNWKPLVGSAWPKINSTDEVELLEKLRSFPTLLEQMKEGSSNPVFYTRKLRYSIQFLNFVPRITENGKRIYPTELKQLSFRSPGERDAA